MNRDGSIPLDQVLLGLVRSRLFIPLLAVSLAAIVIAGLLGMQMLENQQQQVVQSHAAMVDRYLDQANRMLDAVARVAGNSTPEETRTYMQGTLEAYRYFDTLYYLDRDNQVVQMVPLDVRYVGLDMFSMPFYRMTGEQTNYRISRPFISLRTGNPTVYIIRNIPSGGSVVGELSLDSLQQEILASSNMPGRDFVFILDQYGVLIAHPSIELVRQQTNRGDLMIFQRGIAGPATLPYMDDGTLVLGSVAQVDPTGWLVVDQVPVIVVFGPFMLILGVTVVVLLLIWLLLARNLRAQLRSEVIVPLEQFSGGVAALAEGDFSQSSALPLVSGTFVELDLLATDFRHMNRAIQKRQTALEQSREELFRKNEDINAAYEQLTANEEELRDNFEELRERENVIRDSEKKYRTLVETTGTGFVIIATDGRVLDANPEYVRLSGHTNPDEIIGRNVIEWTAKDDREKNAEAVRQCMRDGFIRNFEVNYTDASGHITPVEINATVLRSGTTVQIHTLCRDITDRKRAEEIIQKSGREWQTTFNAITDAVFLLDDRGRIIRHNRALELFTGKTADEINGRYCYEVMHGTTSPIEDCPNVKTQKSRQRESIELKIRSRWVIIAVDPIISETGTYSGAVHLLIDITERKQAEEALNLARKKLNFLNAITFSDIQNSIFSLLGYLDLEKTLPMDEKLRQYKGKEEKIVQTIAESIKFTGIYQSLGLKPLLWQNVQQSFLFGISHLDISPLSRRLEVEGVEIYADPLLENVFFALAENVVRHARTTTELTLRYHESPDGLILYFEDNGTGIPMDLKEKIFEREYERRKGSGLFLAREILSITGITIEETGEPGEGARFEIQVPPEGYRFTRDH